MASAAATARHCTIAIWTEFFWAYQLEHVHELRLHNHTDQILHTRRARFNMF